MLLELFVVLLRLLLCVVVYVLVYVNGSFKKTNIVNIVLVFAPFVVLFEK